MNFTIGKLVVVLAVLGIALGFINFFLVSRFNRQQESILEKNTSKGMFSLFSNTNMDFSQLDIDSLGEYRMQPNFVKATRGSTRGRRDVVMVTHCTANHLHYLLELVEHWKGSISIAVMVPGLDIIAAFKSIIGLHICSNKIRERVTFHVVYPLSHPALMNHLIHYAKQAWKMMPKSCEEFLVGIQTTTLQNKNYASIDIPYPNNLLRNTAWSNTNKDYIFVVDIDMMCNGNLYHDFLKFAEKNNLLGNSQDRKVFVVPAFESQESVSPDLNKLELIRMWDSGKIQPFYYKACWKCQQPTNYDEWKRCKNMSQGIKTCHKVEWKDPWEPFYIGPYHVPLYDDRFKKYGFNRVSQVCETHVAGYDFVVLDNAFLIHRGFKKKFHKQKNEENSINRNLFRKIKKELKTKYPDSTRRC